MPSVIYEMKKALELAGGNVGFTALFLTGLFALWHGKYKSSSAAGRLFGYALLSLVVVIDPLHQILVGRYLPELLRDNMFLWLLPTAPVILYVALEAVEYGKDIWSRLFLVAGMIALLILAATTSYTQSERQILENSHYIPAQEYTVIEQLENYRQEMHKDTVLLWGEDAVMEYARVYSGRIYTLYGKDLWLGSMDSQLHQIYDDWYYEIYNWMEDPAHHIADIGVTAKACGCDVLVLNKGKLTGAGSDLPDRIGEDFYLYYVGEEYLIYVKQ